MFVHGVLGAVGCVSLFWGRYFTHGFVQVWIEVRSTVF